MSMLLPTMIIAARFFQYAGGCLIFGAAVFEILNPSDLTAVPRQWLRTMYGLAAAWVIAGAFLWLAAETATMADAPITGLKTADFTSVAFFTLFGRVCAVRGALALAAFGLVFVGYRKPVSWAMGLLGMALLASFAWTGHGSMTGRLHLGADILHLLAAGLWLGALGPLMVLIVSARHGPDEASAARACRALERFAGAGTLAVALLIATGIVNSWFLIGPRHILDALHAAYGRLLLVKLVLFMGMLSFAARNRFAHTPALARALHGGRSEETLYRLRRSIAAEAILGLLVLIAVAWLGVLEPGMSGGAKIDARDRTRIETPI